MTIVASMVGSDGHVTRVPLPTRAALQAALDRQTERARADLRTHPELPDVYTSGVRYRREPRGLEEWLLPSEVVRRGVGDCEDLATYLAASVGGRAVPVRVSSGWHVVTQYPTGRFEDPSRLLGMGRKGNVMDWENLPDGIHVGWDGDDAIAVGRDGNVIIAYRARSPGEVGGIFGSILGAVKSVVKSKAFRGLAKTALNVASSVIPGGGVAKAALGIAERALSSSKAHAPRSSTPRRSTPRPSTPRSTYRAPTRSTYRARRSTYRAPSTHRAPSTATRAAIPSAQQLKALVPVLRTLPAVDRTRAVRKLLGLP